MAKKNKGFWQNNWTITIGSGIILLIVASVKDFISKLPVLTTISRIISFVWNDILNYKISLWIVLLVTVVIKIARLINARWKKPILNDVVVPESEDPPFINYRRDRLKSWTWSWDYNIRGNNFEIINLIPICEKCNMKMLNSANSLFTCPNCSQYRSTYSNTHESIPKIKALIEHRIENNLY